MKQDNINYLLVGSFLMAISIVFIVLLYAVTGRIADADTYYTMLDDVSGVNDGSSVTYNGYKIGQISGIKPVQKDQKTRFQVTMMVKSGWKITSDSRVQISSKGLLSDAQLSITEGKSSELLAPGGFIEGQVSGNVMAVIESVGKQLNTLSADLIVPLVRQMKDDMSVFGKNMNTQLPELTSNLNSLVERLQNNAETIDAFFSSKNRKSIDVVINNTEQMTQNLKRASDAINQLVKNNKVGMNQSLEKINQSVSVLNAKLESILIQLENTSRNMNDFSHQIKSNPAVIIRSKPVEDPAIR